MRRRRRRRRMKRVHPSRKNPSRARFAASTSKFLQDSNRSSAHLALCALAAAFVTPRVMCSRSCDTSRRAQTVCCYRKSREEEEEEKQQRNYFRTDKSTRIKTARIKTTTHDAPTSVTSVRNRLDLSTPPLYQPGHHWLAKLLLGKKRCTHHHCISLIYTMVVYLYNGGVQRFLPNNNFSFNRY